ncbi:hypothetical protein PRIPAC_84754 [Pristionchus pacificus]|uniref:Uncharacterized protein n=1 Tax=Pristionchus pacificus TaxID=54126 RepID=A0A2A6CBX3_PRIPA|nr:hypothetical protein PRIPAC_84754 [Pristionchus pacificus]|eukprot:PDM75712.1 hypothetical protein PRIPAC_40091 [Pristionchus pacificus]
MMNEPSQEQDTFVGSGLNSQGKLTLNAEQIHYLMGKLSSDEQKDLQDTMRQCTNEITMSRGIPFTMLTLGSLYFARTRLPAKYHFGPKGWPFYFIMGIGSFTAANVMSMGTCRDRVQPKIAQLWQKYGGAESSTNYAALRVRNRGGAEAAGLVPENTPLPMATEQRPSADDTYAARVRYPAAQQRQNNYAYSDTFISGTPSGRPRERLDQSGNQSKTNTYGDEGFS